MYSCMAFLGASLIVIGSASDNIDHEWMMKFVGAIIKDPRILRLVRIMLKAGVVKDLGIMNQQNVEVGRVLCAHQYCRAYTCTMFCCGGFMK